ETVPGYEVSIWYGIAAPRGTPPEIVEKLNQAVNAVLADPKLQARLAELAGEPMPMTPAEFGKLEAEETEKWGKGIRAANIKAEWVRRSRPPPDPRGRKLTEYRRKFRNMIGRPSGFP